MVVEYDRHEITFPDPKILAVLASPPYYPDIMEISGSQTSYTVTSAVSHTNSGNAGFYVSAGIGAGVSFGGNFGETLGFTVSASLETQFSWGWGESVETGTERTFTVDAGSDQVVFTGIPVDTYYYRVLNAPADFSVSPGESITINIPRKPQPGSVELSFYNSMVPEADRIPADLLQHRFGEPFSYHSLAQKNSLQSQPGADSWLLYNRRRVGRGIQLRIQFRFRDGGRWFRRILPQQPELECQKIQLGSDDDPGELRGPEVQPCHLLGGIVKVSACVHWPMDVRKCLHAGS